MFNKYNIQQQMNHQNIMYPAIRTTPSPHSQAYPSALDYSSQIPMILGGMYGPTGPHIHGYSQHMRHGRRGGGESGMALRSPLLDEFRANKARKWELRVSYYPDS
jgi:pumilio RNA-binding family